MKFLTSNKWDEALWLNIKGIYYEAFSEAIGLEENAFQSREILQFALNAIYYLDV